MVGVWADQVPWYYDETPPPAGTPYELNRQLLSQGDPDGTTLNYFDTPQGQPAGTTVNLVTFLISDFQNESYKPLGGFSWSSTIQADGNAAITTLTPNAPFLQEYQDEIGDEFGYVNFGSLIAETPEPSGFALMFTGTLGLVAVAIRRSLGDKH
jgi:hypothetical protein